MAETTPKDYSLIIYSKVEIDNIHNIETVRVDEDNTKSY